MGFISLAATNADADSGLPDQCWAFAKSKHYYIRGDENGTYAGARLWNLDALKRDWGKSDESSQSSLSCLDQVFEKAIQDQSSYWNYIGKKYSCEGTPSAEKIPDEDAGEPCALFATNHQYLKFADAVLSLITRHQQAVNCTPQTQASQPPGTAQAQADAQPASGLTGWMGGVFKALSVPFDRSPEYCKNVPADQRSKVDEKSLGANVGDFTLAGLKTMFVNCPVEFAKAIWDEVKGMVHMAQSIFDKGAIYDAGVKLLREISTPSQLLADLANLPGQMLTSLEDNLKSYFVDQLDIMHFACYNPEEQMRKECQIISKVAAAILLTKGAGVALKAGTKFAVGAAKGVAEAAKMAVTTEGRVALAAKATEAAAATSEKVADAKALLANGGAGARAAIRAGAVEAADSAKDFAKNYIDKRLKVFPKRVSAPLRKAFGISTAEVAAGTIEGADMTEAIQEVERYIENPGFLAKRTLKRLEKKLKNAESKEEKEKIEKQIENEKLRRCRVLSNKDSFKKILQSSTTDPAIESARGATLLVAIMDLGCEKIIPPTMKARVWGLAKGGFHFMQKSIIRTFQIGAGVCVGFKAGEVTEDQASELVKAYISMKKEKAGKGEDYNWQDFVQLHTDVSNDELDVCSPELNLNEFPEPVTSAQP